MSMTVNARRMILVSASILTLLAVLWVANMDEPAAVVAPLVKHQSPATADANTNGAGLGAARVAAARKEAPGKPLANAFAARSFYVAPPKPPAPAPAPPPLPTAPPLPFKYLGRFSEDKASLVIFLTAGDRLYSVRVGDVIDETYRVEKLTPTELIFIYLPMDERQALPIAEAS